MSVPPPGGPRESAALERLLHADLPDVSSSARYARLLAHARQLALAAGRRPIPVADVCGLAALQLDVVTPGRPEPLDGLLGNFSAGPCPPEVWGRRTATHDDRVTPIIRDALNQQDEMFKSRRRHASFVCAAACMSLWLRSMPFSEGNIWCAEVHGLATIAQFEVELPELGPRARHRGAQENYANVLADAIAGRDDPPMARVTRQYGLEGRLFDLGQDPAVAPLAAALQDIYWPFGWEDRLKRSAPPVPGRG